MAAASVPLAGVGWLLDLAANLAAQFAIVGVLGTVALAVSRARRASMAAGAATLAIAVALVSVERAVWHREGGPLMRVLVFNSLASATDATDAVSLILQSNADAVALTEPSSALLDAVRQPGPLRDQYPHFSLPDRARSGYTVVLSRGPQRPLAGIPGRPSVVPFTGARAVAIRAPSGVEVALVLIHPDSPRSVRRWREGREIVERTIELANSLRDEQWPVVVAADLNSTPTGWASRRLSAAARLRRAKPLSAATGTFPAWLPWPLTVAIDDAWVSSDVQVAGWRTLRGGGSDHKAVLVEFAIARASFSASASPR